MPQFLHLNENVELKDFRDFFLGIKLGGSLAGSRKWETAEPRNQSQPTFITA